MTIVLGTFEITFVPAESDNADHWEVRRRLGRHRKVLGYAVNLQGACQIAVGHAMTLAERTKAAKAKTQIETLIQDLAARLAILAGQTGPDDPEKGTFQTQETTSGPDGPEPPGEEGTVRYTITTRVQEDGGPRQVWLRLAEQSFPVGFPSDTPEHAEWYAQMLRRALDRLIDPNSK